MNESVCIDVYEHYVVGPEAAGRCHVSSTVRAT